MKNTSSSSANALFVAYNQASSTIHGRQLIVKYFGRGMQRWHGCLAASAAQSEHRRIERYFDPNPPS